MENERCDFRQEGRLKAQTVREYHLYKEIALLLTMFLPMSVTPVVSITTLPMLPKNCESSLQTGGYHHESGPTLCV